MKKIRVGLVGLGMMGAMHSNCYKALSETVDLVAVAEGRQERLEAVAAAHGATIYKDGMDLIANADVDIIDICLPTYKHTSFALAAMDKVKYLFIEKPVALNAEECDQLEAKQKETGCQIQVGQVIRFWAEYVKLKEYIESGSLGKVVNASFRRISPRPNWGYKSWLTDPSLSGGAAHDLGIHDVDFVLYLFGMPKASHSIVNKIDEAKSFFATHYEYEDFVVCTESTWGLPSCYKFNASFRVAFEKGAIEMAGGKLMLYTDEDVKELELDKGDFTDTDVGGNISELGGYYKELKYFTEQCAAQLPVEKATLSDAANSLRFLMKEANQ